MTNVTNINDHREKPTKLDAVFKMDSPMMFNVGSRRAAVLGRDGTPILDSNHKYLIREDDSADGGIRPIGLVGDGFKWFDNKTFFNAMQQEIVDSSVSLDNLEVKDSWAFHGARCKREYIFKDVTIEPEVGDVIAFRLFGWNAFDGSMSWRVGGGALRLICLNGQLSDAGHDITIRKHTSGASIPALTHHIKTYIDVFYQQADVWKRWMNKVITDEDAEVCFSAIPNMSERLLKNMMMSWLMQIVDTGRTVWSLYNVATYWASHGEEDDPYTIQKARDTGTNHQVFTLYQREQRVRQWIGSRDFQQLAA